LDLFQFTAGCVTETGTRPPQIVRRQFRDLQFLGAHLDDMPDNLFCHPVTPNASWTANASEQFAIRDFRRGELLIKELLHPVRHRDRSNVTSLADKVNDGPTILAPLQVIETEVRQFASSQAAPK
jgi:hypothetical protein